MERGEPLPRSARLVAAGLVLNAVLTGVALTNERGGGQPSAVEVLNNNYSPLPYSSEQPTPATPEAQSPALPNAKYAPLERPNSRDQRFVATYLKLAKAVSAKYSIPVDVTLAQASHESNYGTSGLAQTCNNFFGLKAQTKGFATWAGPVYGSRTYEILRSDQLSGRQIESSKRRPDGMYEVVIIGGFRCYQTARQSFLDYGYYLRNRGLERPGEFYADAFKETDPVKFLKQLTDDDDGAAGPQKRYATDPEYFKSVSKRIVAMQAARLALHQP